LFVVEVGGQEVGGLGREAVLALFEEALHEGAVDLAEDGGVREEFQR
jgi:hypothetical protein